MSVVALWFWNLSIRPYWDKGRRNDTAIDENWKNIRTRAQKHSLHPMVGHTTWKTPFSAPLPIKNCRTVKMIYNFQLCTEENMHSHSMRAPCGICVRMMSSKSDARKQGCKKNMWREKSDGEDESRKAVWSNLRTERLMQKGERDAIMGYQVCK